MLLAVVPDAIERSDEIIRDQQRTIRQLRHVDGATQVIAIVVPPLGKRLGLSCGVAVEGEVKGRPLLIAPIVKIQQGLIQYG